jgi:hypothetical protein
MELGALVVLEEMAVQQETQEILERKEIPETQEIMEQGVLEVQVLMVEQARLEAMAVQDLINQLL